MALARTDPESLDFAMSEPDETQSQTASRVISEAGLMTPPKMVSMGERTQIAVRINEALASQYNPLESHVLLKQAVNILETSMEINKEAAINTLDVKETSVFGAKVVSKYVREWEYEDDTLIKLEEQKKEIALQIKERQYYLQMLNKQHQEGVDPTSGEMVKAAKLIKDGTQIAITLPK